MHLKLTLDNSKYKHYITIEGVNVMATFEIETIHYNKHGNIKKEFELFDSKQKAVQHMRYKISTTQELQQVGRVKDGEVKLVDDRGTIKQSLKLSQLL